LPLPAEGDGLLAVPHLDWTEDPKFEHVRFVTPARAAHKRR
jgi:hypothetical protein